MLDRDRLPCAGDAALCGTAETRALSCSSPLSEGRAGCAQHQDVCCHHPGPQSGGEQAGVGGHQLWQQASRCSRGAHDPRTGTLHCKLCSCSHMQLPLKRCACRRSWLARDPRPPPWTPSASSCTGAWTSGRTTPRQPSCRAAAPPWRPSAPRCTLQCKSWMALSVHLVQGPISLPPAAAGWRVLQPPGGCLLELQCAAHLRARVPGTLLVLAVSVSVPDPCSVTAPCLCHIYFSRATQLQGATSTLPSPVLCSQLAK